MAMTATVATKPAASVQSRARMEPAIIWAWVGLAILALQLYSMGTWIFSDRFVPTPTGVDVMPAADLLRLRCMEGASAIAFVLLIAFIVVRPWRRDGRPSFDGLLVLAWGLMTWQDPMVNYISAQYLLNSNLINFGSWTLGSTPGWVSPNGNLLPEPIILYPAVYMLFGIVPVAVLCAAWRGYQRRYPDGTRWGYIAIALALGILLDFLAEVAMIRGGVFAYPNAVQSVTLWAGTLHQFPLYEGLFVCFVMTAGACLRFFKDDRGETWVERGVHRLQLRRMQTPVRFLAVYAYIQLAMIVTYDVPMMLVSLHTDTFVSGYPSYMVNGLCVSGVNANECPGRGVAIPRR